MPRARKAPQAQRDPDALRLAVLPLINTVIYPQVAIGLYVTREPSARAVEEAVSRNLPLLVVAQRDANQEDVGPDDLFTMGTEATIGRVLKLPDGHTNVLVQGQRRMRILGYEQITPFLSRSWSRWRRAPRSRCPSRP